MRVPRPPAKMTTFMTTNIYKGSKTYVIEQLINVKRENVLTWYPLFRARTARTSRTKVCAVREVLG